jgi:hypothetical protein
MRQQIVRCIFIVGILSVLLGCGEDDFQAGNRLLIESITDLDGSTALIFPAVEETDDTGLDGIAGTGDQGENNARCDGGLEDCGPLGPDLGVITLRNEPRLGVDQGVPLTVVQVRVNYRDWEGNSQPFAPEIIQHLPELVDDGQSKEIEFILVPLAMKTAQGGLRDAVLAGSPLALPWRATVDVFARDERNKDIVHARKEVTLNFINPNVARPR